MEIMKKIAITALIVAQTASPAAAAELIDARADSVRPGAFAGARLRISLDSGPRERVRAGLTLAPTRHVLRTNGSNRLRFGEGVELGSGERGGPQVLVAGQPIRHVVEGGGAPEGARSNMSTVAWVAIGVGVLAVGAFLLYGLCGSGEICDTEDD